MISLCIGRNYTFATRDGKPEQDEEATLPEPEPKNKQKDAAENGQVSTRFWSLTLILSLLRETVSVAHLFGENIDHHWNSMKSGVIKA